MLCSFISFMTLTRKLFEHSKWISKTALLLVHYYEIIHATHLKFPSHHHYCGIRWNVGICNCSVSASVLVAHFFMDVPLNFVTALKHVVCRMAVYEFYSRYWDHKYSFRYSVLCEQIFRYYLSLQSMLVSISFCSACPPPHF